MTQPIFDGHNDCLLKLYRGGPGAGARYRGGMPGHVDLPKAKAGGFAGGFYAMFVPDEGPMDWSVMRNAQYDLPLPPMVAQEAARAVVVEQAAILKELHDHGDLTICTNAATLRDAIGQGQQAAIMHLEGAEAIDPELQFLDTLYDLGLRSLGPVWSRPTIFGHGVPFRYPSDGDTGPGLTDAGFRLVERCAQMGIIVDLSHLNVAGFHDVATTGVPLVATHSNAHAICPHARNLTDDQLRMIGRTNGMVGLNFASAFLRPDGQMLPQGALEWMVRHLDHMIELAGEDHVGFGSDFDGAVVPEEIGSVAGLDALREAMVTHGYDDAMMGKLCAGNWIALCERVWKPAPRITVS